MLVYFCLRSVVRKENSSSHMACFLRIWECNYVTEGLSAKREFDRAGRVSHWHKGPSYFPVNPPSLNWDPHPRVKLAIISNFPISEHWVINATTDSTSWDTRVLRYLANQRADKECQLSNLQDTWEIKVLGSILDLLTPRGQTLKNGRQLLRLNREHPHHPDDSWKSRIYNWLLGNISHSKI